MVEEKKFQMEYRYLGKTGLKVSVLSFGNMITVIGEKDKQQQFMDDSVSACLKYGINFFDTAELYGMGHAEIQLGNSFKTLNVKREEVVVTTKLFWMPAGFDTLPPHFEHYKTRGINMVGLSRKKIIESAKAALKRL